MEPNIADGQTFARGPWRWEICDQLKPVVLVLSRSPGMGQ